MEFLKPGIEENLPHIRPPLCRLGWPRFPARNRHHGAFQKGWPGSADGGEGQSRHRDPGLVGGYGWKR